MFIEALFTIGRTWKQPRCPSADEWIRKLWYIYTMEYSVQFSSVQLSRSVMSDSLWSHDLQHARPPCHHQLLEFTQTHIQSWWCHPVISFCHPLLLPPSIFPSIRGFPISQFFTSGGQSIVVSASTLVLPMNIQDWFPLGWTGWIFLQSKGLSRVFSSTTVQKHQFFAA